MSPTQKPNNLHHAYFLVGERASAEAFVSDLFKKVGFKEQGNPDLFLSREETFGIGEARALSERAQRKAFGDKKFFLIYSPIITREAQNALLKTFEDPTPNTHFIIVGREEGLLIPTLLSRMQAVRLAGSEKSIGEEAKEFLTLPLKDRINFAKSFAEEALGNELPIFLDELMLALQKGEDKEALKNIFNIRKFSDDKSASPRLILEHLALTLP